MQGPLSGVKVLDLSINVLGPLSCRLLGDLGADVIKIEPPAGDPQRRFGPARSAGMPGYFMQLNRSKRSVVLNLKRPDSLEALMRLVETADVLVHSMRLKSAERLGVGYEAVSERNPRIIYACGTGYGQSGWRRDLPAYDDVIQAESGIADLMHRATGKPRYVPMPLADKFCGHAQASAIGMALYARERTGKGQAVYTPMLETMVSFAMVEHWWGAVFDPPIGGVGHPRMFAQQRRPLESADGYICLMAHSDAEWRRLFGLLGRPGLAVDPRFASAAMRTEHVEALYDCVALALREHTTAHWRDALDAAGIPNCAVARLDELVNDTYLNDSGFLRYVQHPSEGPVLDLRPPAEFSETRCASSAFAPTLGEHTAIVLGELGYGDASIGCMTT